MPPSLTKPASLVLALVLAGPLACDQPGREGASSTGASEAPAPTPEPATQPTAKPAAKPEAPAPSSAEPAAAPQPPSPAPAPLAALDDAAAAAHERVLAELGDGFEIHALGSRRFLARDGLDITTGFDRFELDGEEVIGISGEQRELALDRSGRALALAPETPREQLHAAVLHHLGSGYALNKRGATTVLARGSTELTKAHLFWVHEGEVWAKLGATRWLVIDRDQQFHDLLGSGAAPPTTRKPMPLKLSISAKGCALMGGEVQDCAKLCEDDAALEGVDAAILEASETNEATKTQLGAILTCLAAKQIAVSLR